LNPPDVPITRCIRAIVLAGFLAGTLDANAAVVNYFLNGGTDPVRVFLFIASGVFGRAAVNADRNLAWWGFIFHFIIALGWTVLYFAAYRRIKALVRNQYISGLGYGVFVWLVMNLVVVPLSNTPPLPFDLSRALVGVAILMACIGLPISLIAHRCYSRYLASPEV
jgi:hypothetical protein